VTFDVLTRVVNFATRLLMPIPSCSDGFGLRFANRHEPRLADGVDREFAIE
jgi:hypothetical protein